MTLQNRLIADGRPIWVTDLRDPANPKVSDEPVDLYRNDGYTDYSHDVDEDERGIAWVAGRGGIRGYATSGRHRDPYQNRVREATPFDPILVAGGGLEWDEPPDNVNNASDPNDGVSEATDFMHNSGRPTDGWVKASGVKTGNVLIGTEEDFTTPCQRERQDRGGRHHRLAGRRAGTELDADEAVPDERAGQLPSVPRHAGDDQSRERVLRALLRDPPVDAGGRLVHPGPAPGGREQRPPPAPGRLLPRDRHRDGQPVVELVGRRLVQRGSGRRARASRKGKKNKRGRKSTHNSKGDYVYLMDMSRGIEVIRLKGGSGASARMKSVTAPSVRKDDPWAAKPVAGSSLADGAFVCPLFQ